MPEAITKPGRKKGKARGKKQRNGFALPKRIDHALWAAYRQYGLDQWTLKAARLHLSAA
jgi:hypothetical protein